MSKGGKKRRRDSLTPEQRAEKFSTGGLSFEESPRRVLAGGPDEHRRAATGDGEERPTTRRMSQQEIEELLERERARRADPNYRGTLVPPPYDLLRALDRQPKD